MYMFGCNSQDERAAADAHEEILAGLTSERPHSRFLIWRGNRYQGYQLDRVQWSYDGKGGMLKIRGMESQAFTI
jgi:hypothetical protein